MNSSFKIDDDWSTSPFNLGNPSFVSSVPKEPAVKGKRGSSPLKLQQKQRAVSGQTDGSGGEVKIFVEPTLFVQRVVDPVNKRLSAVIEHLPIEAHLLIITSERVTPQLLEKEEKTKRLKEEQDQEAEEEARLNQQQAEEEAKAASKLSTKAERISDRRRRSQEDTGSSKRRRLTQEKPASPQLQDTVLVRLSSGQVVRVPREILKKVGSIQPTPAPSQNLTIHHPPPVSSSPSARPHAVPLPKLPLTPIPVKPTPVTSTPAIPTILPKLELPFQGRLNAVLSRLSGVPEVPIKSEEVVNREQIILNGILEKLAKSNKSHSGEVRAIKIRAYQGQNDSNLMKENEFGTKNLFSQIGRVVKLTDPVQPAVNDKPQGVMKITIPPSITVTMKSPIKCVKLTSPVKQSSLQMLQTKVPRPPMGSPKLVFHTLPMSEAIKVISPYVKKGENVVKNGVEHCSNDRKTIGSISLLKPSNSDTLKLPSTELSQKGGQTDLKPALHFKNDLKTSSK